jgi:hypothetical protein
MSLENSKKRGRPFKVHSKPEQEELIFETEFIHLRELMYITTNWKNLAVGRAYVNGEIVDRDAFYTIITDIAKSIKTSKQKFPMGERTIKYKLPRLGYGRKQCINHGFINMSRPIRQTLARENYIDIDVVNAHLYIYRFLCVKYGVKETVLTHYIDNREESLSLLMEANNISRDDAKKCYLERLNGGSAKMIKIDDKKNWFSKYYYEMTRIHEEMYDNISVEYKEALEYVIKNYGQESNNILNFKCKVISKILEKVEAEMEDIMVQSLRKMGFNVSSHCYDGCMSFKPLNIGKEINSTILKEVEKEIIKGLQFYVPLKIKEFDEFLSIPEDEINKYTYLDWIEFIENLEGSYNAVKREFEKNYFFDKAKLELYTIDEGQILKYSLNDAKSYFENKFYNEYEKDKLEKKPFFSKWLKDENRKEYNVVWVPTGGEVKENQLNLYQKMVVERLPATGKTNDGFSKYMSLEPKLFELEMKTINYEKDTFPEIFFKHISYLTNYNKDETIYTIKWLAHIFQTPYKKTNVMVGIKSEVEGIGKTFLYDIIYNMMGSQLCYKTAEPTTDTSVLGKYNGDALAYKLFIMFEEMNNDIIKNSMSRFYNLITTEEDNINYKGGKTSKIQSFTNFYSAWNKNGLRPSKEARRFFLTECIQAKKEDEYYQYLVKNKNNKHNLKYFYEYLLNVNIVDFNPQSHMPQTQLRQEMNALSKPIINQWFEDFVTSYYNTHIDITTKIKKTGQELFKEFYDWCKRCNINYHPNISSFGKDMKKIVELWNVNHTKPKNVMTYHLNIKELYDFGVEKFNFSQEEEEKKEEKEEEKEEEKKESE